MSESAPAPSTGQIIGGIAFVLGWALLHVVLFYAFVVSGFLVDILLSIVKSIMFPGTAHTAQGAHEMLAWEGILRVGLIIAGVAGIPGGLAMFMSRRRKLLRRGFWLMLLVGVLCELYAFGILINNAFTVPS